MLIHLCWPLFEGQPFSTSIIAISSKGRTKMGLNGLEQQKKPGGGFARGVFPEEAISSGPWEVKATPARSNL